MSNRDFWSKPIQSDRLSHGYGHTQLSHDTEWQMPMWVWMLIGITLAVLVVCNV